MTTSHAAAACSCCRREATMRSQRQNQIHQILMTCSLILCTRVPNSWHLSTNRTSASAFMLHTPRHDHARITLLPRRAREPLAPLSTKLHSPLLSCTALAQTVNSQSLKQLVMADHVHKNAHCRAMNPRAGEHQRMLLTIRDDSLLPACRESFLQRRKHIKAQLYLLSHSSHGNVDGGRTEHCGCAQLA